MILAAPNCVLSRSPTRVALRSYGGEITVSPGRANYGAGPVKGALPSTDATISSRLRQAPARLAVVAIAPVAVASGGGSKPSIP